MSKFVFFLFQRSAGTSPLETWTSTKALSSTDDCISQCSPGLPDGHQEQLELVNKPL